MNGTQNVQLVPECLQSTTNFGSTVMQNVCDGTVHTIPWGGADWVFALFLIGLGFAFVGGALTMVWKLATDF